LAFFVQDDQFLFGVVPKKVLDCNVDQIGTANEFDNRPLEQVGRQANGDHSKNKRSDQPVGKGLGPLVLGQTLDEHPQHQSVVDRQKTFQDDEQADDHQIGAFDALSENVDR
jgi:hypothetical protein